MHRPIAAASACAPRKSIPFGRVDNIVLADPQLPDPWDPETWARLSVEDRKMHRQKQQQDKEDPTQKKRGGVVSSRQGLLQTDIGIGDYVEVLQGLMPYIGYYGVVRKIRQHNVDTLACFVELQLNPAGQPVTQEQINDIIKMNSILSLPEANLKHLLFCDTFNVVLADPRPPAPWTPETWARLPFQDRKMHR